MQISLLTGTNISPNNVLIIVASCVFDFGTAEKYVSLFGPSSRVYPPSRKPATTLALDRDLTRGVICSRAIISDDDTRWRNSQS